MSSLVLIPTLALFFSTLTPIQEDPTPPTSQVSKSSLDADEEASFAARQAGAADLLDLEMGFQEPEVPWYHYIAAGVMAILFLVWIVVAIIAVS